MDRRMGERGDHGREDCAARNFAIGFYGGLGEGASIAAAFAQGTAAINLDGLSDADKPQLKVRAGFDAAHLILATVGSPGLVDVPCPYPGMRQFGAYDAGSFYGRDAEIHEMLVGCGPVSARSSSLARPDPASPR